MLLEIHNVIAAPNASMTRTASPTKSWAGEDPSREICAGSMSAMRGALTPTTSKGTVKPRLSNPAPHRPRVPLCPGASCRRCGFVPCFGELLNLTPALRRQSINAQDQPPDPGLVCSRCIAAFTLSGITFIASP
jgi:hypothetical protein